MDLSKWNPFKFLRKDDDAKKAGIAKAVPATAQASASNQLAPHQAMGQMMQQMMRDPFALWREGALGEPFGMNTWFGDFSPAAFQPHVDVVDEGKVLRVTAELPGMDAGDVTLTVGSGALTIKGEKRIDEHIEEQGCYRTERAYGFFQRVIPLPSDVTGEGIEAQFDKGLLTVRVPKPRETEKKLVEIPISSA